MSFKDPVATFSGQAMHWIVKLMGDDLIGLPDEASSRIEGDGILYWRAWNDAGGRHLIELWITGSIQEPIPLHVRFELLGSTMQATALFVRDLRAECGFVRPDDPITASALDRIATKWLARRFNAGHRLRADRPVVQAA